MGPIFNEKIDKNEIYGSVNSARMHYSLKKVNICGYCSLNSSRTPPKTRENKKKKKKKEKNANVIYETWIQTEANSSWLAFDVWWRNKFAKDEVNPIWE